MEVRKENSTEGIEDVMDIRTTTTRKGTHRRYLVKWKGRPLTDSTWIDAEELQLQRPDIYQQLLKAFSSGDEVLPLGGN